MAKLLIGLLSLRKKLLHEFIIWFWTNIKLIHRYISKVYIFHIPIFNARKVKIETIGKEFFIRPPPLQSSELQHVTLL